MRIKFFIDTDQKTIIEVFEGEITLPAIGKSIPHVWRHPDYSPTLQGILDFRKAKVAFSNTELHDLIKSISDDDRGSRGKVAFIVSEPLLAAMATIYEERMKEFQSVAIFCHQENALNFLGIDASIFDKINHPDAVSVDLSED